MSEPSTASFDSGLIALQHGHIPAGCGDTAVWINTGWNLLQHRLQQTSISFPLKIRIPNAVPVEIHKEDGNAVLYDAFPQVTQIWTPLSRMAQIFRDPLGQQNVSVVSAIHDPLRKVNPRSGDVCRIVYVANFIDRSAVDAHSQLQLRILFQLLADLDRAPHRRFWTIKKNERHPITHGKSNQLPRSFGAADLLGTADNFSQLLLILTLLIEKLSRISDQIHKQNVANL